MIISLAFISILVTAVVWSMEAEHLSRPIRSGQVNHRVRLVHSQISCRTRCQLAQATSLVRSVHRTIDGWYLRLYNILSMPVIPTRNPRPINCNLPPSKRNGIASKLPNLSISIRMNLSCALRMVNYCDRHPIPIDMHPEQWKTIDHTRWISSATTGRCWTCTTDHSRHTQFCFSRSWKKEVLFSKQTRIVWHDRFEDSTLVYVYYSNKSQRERERATAIITKFLNSFSRPTCEKKDKTESDYSGNRKNSRSLEEIAQKKQEKTIL